MVRERRESQRQGRRDSDKRERCTYRLADDYNGAKYYNERDKDTEGVRTRQREGEKLAKQSNKRVREEVREGIKRERG